MYSLKKAILIILGKQSSEEKLIFKLLEDIYEL